MIHNNKKNVLVIGGEGFIGRNICSCLGTGHNVTSAGIICSLFPDRKDKYLSINPYIDNVDPKYDTYIHLVDNSINLNKYVLAEEKLLENLHISKNSHLIIFSSAAVYANPDSEYAQRKICLENTYREYCQNNNINLTIFRLFNIYGSYQIPYRPGGLVANLFYNYIKDIPTEINDMNATRDFIYASDMGNAVLQAVNTVSYGEYDLSTGKLISIRDLIRYLEDEVMQNKIKITDKHGSEKKFTTVSTVNYPIKQPLTSLANGLKSTYSYFKDNEYIISQYLK